MTLTVGHPERMRARWLVVAGVAIAVIVLVAGTFVIESSGERSSDSSDSRLTVAPLTIPPRLGDMVVFGDSWTQGINAKPRSLGFAVQVGVELGLKTRSQGVGGSGYVAGGENSYSNRLSRLPVDDQTGLMLMQSSINDLGQGGVIDGFVAAIRSAKVTFPRASIVVLGPETTEIPVNPSLTQMSSDIGRAAIEQGVYFISPLLRNWITQVNEVWVIDAVTKHPSTSGHTFIAAQIVAALREYQETGQRSAEGA